MELNSIEAYPIRDDNSGVFTFTSEDGSEFEISMVDFSSRLSSYCSFEARFFDLIIDKVAVGNGQLNFSLRTRTAKTISFFIEEHLRKNPDSIIFCYTSTKNEKQEARARLFSTWLNNYDSSFVCFNGLAFEASGKNLMAYWFYRDDHPHKNELLDVFIRYYNGNF
jgi:hypothetical protein